MSNLQVTWFFIIAFFLIVYAALDGFDLGVGFWYKTFKDAGDRDKLIKAIGPVWDGNEVWLLSGGAVIFAAFPKVYALVFSSLYPALMIVIFALIFRAVSVEFLQKHSGLKWRSLWEKGFVIGSALPAFLYGVAAGNILRGLSIDEKLNYAGGFWDLLNPFCLLAGFLSLCVFAMHGAAYLFLKTDGGLQDRSAFRLKISSILSVVVWICFVVFTTISQTHLIKNYAAHPVLIALPFLVLFSAAGTYLFCVKGSPKKAFICSTLTVILILSTFTAFVFPNIVFALGRPDLNLTVANASSSELTLTAMLVITFLGMPAVIYYYFWLYRTFKGTV